MDALGDKLRAVVVTDFERTSSNALIENLLDDEAGGAIAVFKHLPHLRRWISRPYHDDWFKLADGR